MIFISFIVNIAIAENPSDFFERLLADKKLRESVSDTGSVFLTQAEIARIAGIEIKSDEDILIIKGIVDKASANNRLNEITDKAKKEVEKKPGSLSLRVSLAFSYGRKGQIKEEYSEITEIEKIEKQKPKLSFSIVQAYGRLGEKQAASSLDAIGVTTIKQAKELEEKIWLFIESEKEAQKWIGLAITGEDWDFAEYLAVESQKRKLIDETYANEKLAFIYEKNTVVVKNAIELVKAIKSNARIQLNPGSYDLAAAYSAHNPVFTWETFGPYNPTIVSVSNLKLIGKGKTAIRISPDGPVLSFVSCKKITLENIVFGHEGTPNSCGPSDDVLVFNQSTGIEIKQCELYGCGAVGIILENASDVSVSDSIIRNCTYGLLQINNTTKVRFDNTKFYETQSYSNGHIAITDSREITFTSCQFYANTAENFLFVIQGASSAIKAVTSRFTNNHIMGVVEDKSKVQMIDCVDQGNFIAG